MSIETKILITTNKTIIEEEKLKNKLRPKEDIFVVFSIRCRS